MVLRGLGRRSNDYYDGIPSYSQRRDQFGIGLEVGQVVVLLEAGIAEEPIRPGTSGFHRRHRDRIGGEDQSGCAEGDLALAASELVVVHLGKRNS